MGQPEPNRRSIDSVLTIAPERPTVSFDAFEQQQRTLLDGQARALEIQNAQMEKVSARPRGYSRGTHTSTAHLDELKGFAPFGLHYCVRSPNLANLLPLSAQISTLTIERRCADFKPALQLDRLEKIVVASEDVTKAFAVLGGRAGLMIADPITASDDEGAARLRAEHLP